MGINVPSSYVYWKHNTLLATYPHFLMQMYIAMGNKKANPKIKKESVGRRKAL